MGAPGEVYELVEKFDRDRPDSETEVRDWYVDPFFSALGWDMQAKAQVRKERSITVREEGLERSKRPDYSFNIGDTVRFFVETKMPHINLERNRMPAFQVRRYGWSKQLAVSVLTDFEEFCVYDCRFRPYQSDPAGRARLFYCGYDEYVDKWDEIASRFSYQAVADGELERWIAGDNVRGAKSVDQEFLSDMEKWREILAKDIALRNQLIGQRNLNLVVQRIIDRIIFLRIAEDRNFESYGRLKRAAGPGRQVYQELMLLFHEADDKYNSGLFHFGNETRASEPDTLSQSLDIGSDELRHIIENLYFPDSPFEFSVMPPEILGQVYEQFLGKVIELSPGGAVRVESKPEVRKAGGVYYTPTYIVDYIVKNTVGELLKSKSPDEAAKLRILDPACGSGSFLTGAYQYLLDWHLNYYRKHPNQYRNRRRETGDGMILTTAEKRRILLNNIYGVDLDQNAVEVSKLSLLLKMLENESDATGGQTLMFAAGGRILPDLSGNIKWGNSLIGSDFFRGAQAALFDDEAEMQRIKAFDWDSESGFGEIMASGGFDAVIGNPPYVKIQTMMEWDRESAQYYRSEYRSAGRGNYDIYVIFLQKSLSLVSATGLIGFIIPHKFFNSRFGQPIRKFIVERQAIQQIVDFGANQVFDDATTYTCLLFLAGKKQQSIEYIEVSSLAEKLELMRCLSEREEHKDYDIAKQPQPSTGSEWYFFARGEDKVLDKIRQLPLTLEDITRKIFVGIQTSADRILVLDVEQQFEESVRCYSRSLGTTVDIENGLVKPFLMGKDVHRYTALTPTKVVIFPYEVRNNSAHLIPLPRIESSFPKGFEYLQSNRAALKARENSRFSDTWWQYGRLNNLTEFEVKKLITPDICKYPQLSIDNTAKIYHTTTLYSFAFNSMAKEAIEYFLGILNSNLMWFFMKSTGTVLRGGYIRFKTAYLNPFPIRTIDFDNPADVAMHDKMVELVDEMLNRHKQLPSLTGEGRKIAERLIETVDDEIDALVYRLYGLSADEVSVVEGGSPGAGAQSLTKPTGL